MIPKWIIHYSQGYWVKIFEIKTTLLKEKNVIKYLGQVPSLQNLTGEFAKKMNNNCHTRPSHELFPSLINLFAISLKTLLQHQFGESSIPLHLEANGIFIIGDILICMYFPSLHAFWGNNMSLFV